MKPLSLRHCLGSPLIFLLLAQNVLGAESVTFSSYGVDKNNLPLTLEGIISTPQGRGRFPGVVLLHGSGGIRARRDADWVKRLTGWGYVTLQVDSFGPRHTTPAEVIYHASKVEHEDRAKDAHGALDYLAKQPYIDPGRIAVMGWSHGGLSTIVAVLESYGPIRFKAAVAFYPYCDRSLDWVNAPLLILTGQSDDWCPAWLCSQMVPTGHARHEVILKIYPNAYHDFDWAGLDKKVKGHRVKFDAKATEDSILQVKRFLSRYLSH